MLQIFAEKPAVRRAFLDFVPKKARPICIINISACTQTQNVPNVITIAV